MQNSSSWHYAHNKISNDRLHTGNLRVLNIVSNYVSSMNYERLRDSMDSSNRDWKVWVWNTKLVIGSLGTSFVQSDIALGLGYSFLVEQKKITIWHLAFLPLAFLPLYFWHFCLWHFYLWHFYRTPKKCLVNSHLFWSVILNHIIFISSPASNKQAYHSSDQSISLL